MIVTTQPVLPTALTRQQLPDWLRSRRQPRNLVAPARTGERVPRWRNGTPTLGGATGCPCPGPPLPPLRSPSLSDSHRRGPCAEALWAQLCQGWPFPWVPTPCGEWALATSPSAGSGPRRWSGEEITGTRSPHPEGSWQRLVRWRADPSTHTGSPPSPVALAAAPGGAPEAAFSEEGCGRLWIVSHSWWTLKFCKIKFAYIFFLTFIILLNVSVRSACSWLMSTLQ